MPSLFGRTIVSLAVLPRFEGSSKPDERVLICQRSLLLSLSTRSLVVGECRDSIPTKWTLICRIVSGVMDKALVLLFVLLDVVEAQGEDLDDDLKEDFGPIVLTVIADRTQFLFLHDFAVL